jgi:hypothetical protein
MLNRSAQSVPQRFALTPLEFELLDRLVVDKKPTTDRKNASDYLAKIAELGGYLARANDPPPGGTVMWRGMSRLTDIELGFTLAQENCG